MDFGDTMTQINRSHTPEQADQYAMAAYLRAIGADLRIAMDRFEQENDVTRRDK